MTKESLDKKQTENIESKEKEKPSELFLFYRDNDLFKEWMPEIVESLESMGNNVEIKGFPAGTDREEIEQWGLDNKDKFQGKTVLCDYTVESGIPSREEFKKTEIPPKRTNPEEMGVPYGGKLFYQVEYYLDYLTQVVTAKALTGEGYKEMFDEEGVTTDMVKKGFETCIHEIIKKKENVPQKIYISLYKILHHAPGGLYKEFKIPTDYGMTYCMKLEGEDRKKCLKMRDGVASRIKDWLIGGGIEAQNIEIIDDSSEEQDISGNWVIEDRHNRDLTFKNAVRLQLPLSNFVQDAQKKGLIEIDPERFKIALKETLEENFGQEKKE